MGMGCAPTWLRQVSPPASQNHFTHCNRLLKSVLFGSMEVVRCRGRQSKRWLDNIIEWTGLSIGDAVNLIQDRDVWRSFVFVLNGPWPWDMMMMMMMILMMTMIHTAQIATATTHLPATSVNQSRSALVFITPTRSGDRIRSTPYDRHQRCGDPAYCQVNGCNQLLIAVLLARL